MERKDNFIKKYAAKEEMIFITLYDLAWNSEYLRPSKRLELGKSRAVYWLA